MDTYTGSHLVIFGAFALFLLLAVGVVLVLWIFMPFSVFGLKGQIRALAAEQQRTNELLESLVRYAREGPASTPTVTPSPSPAGPSGGAGDVKEPGPSADKDSTPGAGSEGGDFRF